MVVTETSQRICATGSPRLPSAPALPCRFIPRGSSSLRRTSAVVRFQHADRSTSRTIIGMSTSSLLFFDSIRKHIACAHAVQLFQVVGGATSQSSDTSVTTPSLLSPRTAVAAHSFAPTAHTLCDCTRIDGDDAGPRGARPVRARSATFRADPAASRRSRCGAWHSPFTHVWCQQIRSCHSSSWPTRMQRPTISRTHRRADTFTERRRRRSAQLSLSHATPSCLRYATLQVWAHRANCHEG